MKVRVLVVGGSTAQVMRTVFERAGCEVAVAPDPDPARPTAMLRSCAEKRLHRFVTDRNDWRQDRRRQGRKA